MPEDDSVSLVLCYVGGTGLHPMNIKAEGKRFSVVVSVPELDYKITNTNTVHPLNMSRVGSSVIKDKGSLFFFPLYILTVKPRGWK